MSQLARQAGFKPSQIEASDISFMSTVFGYAVMEKSLEDLEIEFVDVPELDDLDLADHASVLWGMNYCRLLAAASANYRAEQMTRAALLEREEQIANLQEQIERARQSLQGFSYRPLDLFDHLAEIAGDPKAVTVIVPPTETLTHGQLYTVDDKIRWKEPGCTTFDPGTGIHDLMALGQKSKALMLVYAEFPAGQAVGEPVMVEEGTRYTDGELWSAYLLCNRADEVLDMMGGFGLKRGAYARIDEARFPIPPDDYLPTPDSRLELKVMPGGMATYFRLLWQPGLGVLRGQSGDALAVFLDGYLVGVLRYDYRPDEVALTMMASLPAGRFQYDRLVFLVAMNRLTVSSGMRSGRLCQAESLTIRHMRGRPEEVPFDDSPFNKVIRRWLSWNMLDIPAWIFNKQ
jgi:hypothetical protein